MEDTAHPFRSAFSTDIDEVNSWVNTIHIHTSLRKELHKCLQMQPGSKLEDVLPRRIKVHAEHVKNSKQKLCGYGIDPFSMPLGIYKLVKSHFQLRISSVNLTKFSVSCGFGHIY